MLAPTVDSVIVVMSKPRIIFLNRYSVHGLFRALSYRKAKIKVIAMIASLRLYFISKAALPNSHKLDLRHPIYA